MEIRQKIEAAFRHIAKEQGKRLAPIAGDLPLLQSGLDSLGFALLVANLEDELGFDPFTESEDVELPVTFDDFVRLYEHAQKVT
jgi:acyl carrier protein